ncbi:hypothetical protein ACFV0B_24370 [Streptomyces xanthophaeus]|uniref:hypothetical protein n=1 Tax=Streptomyces xanthophaeus TaxID=67385 RepID=UPI0036BBC069
MDFDFLGGFIGGPFGGGMNSPRYLKRQARLFEEGGTLVFHGCVLGDRPYCRPTAVHLSASHSGLGASPTACVEVSRRVVPVERLEIECIRPRRKGDPAAVWSSWQVLECRDGDARVLIACEPNYLRYVQGLIERRDPAQV